MSTSNIAAVRLQKLLSSQGEGILALQSSAKVLVNRELHDFPEERQVLITVLERGLIKSLLDAESSNREQIHVTTINQLVKQSGMHPEWARWAIHTWSSAIAEARQVQRSKPGPKTENPQALEQGHAALRMEIRDGRDSQEEILKGGSPVWMRFVMTLMVALAGFSGGFLGRNLPIGIILVGFEAVDSTVGKEQFEEIVPKNKRLSTFQKVIAFTVFFVVNGSLSALGGLAGSTIGWLFGRADGRPWMGVSACFSAAFGVNIIFSLLGCGLLIAPIATALACFGAGFKTAATTA